MRSRLTLLCFTLLGLTTSAWAAWPTLGRPAPAADRPGLKDAALIIAIEDYAFVEDIPGARANGEDWDRWFEARGTPISRIVTVTDTAAVREEILDVARRTAAEVPPDGTLWIVYIGHGAPAKDGQDGLLVGADAQQKATSVYARSVARRELIEAVAGGRQRESILVLDACFSGKGGTGSALLPGLQPLVPVALAPVARVTVLSAGAGDEFAGPLPGLGRPAFSYLVLGALHGWRQADEDADGQVSLGEAVAYSRGALRRVVRDRRQTPEIMGESSARSVTPARLDGPDLRAAGEAPAAPATLAVAPTTLAPARRMADPPDPPNRHAGSPGVAKAGEVEPEAPPSGPVGERPPFARADFVSAMTAARAEWMTCASAGTVRAKAELLVLPTGRIGRVTFPNSKLDPAVARCLATRIGRVRLAPFAGEALTISYPIVL